VGPNRRAQDRERAATEAAIKAKRAEAERKTVAEAQKIVAIWNARPRQAGGRQSLVALSNDALSQASYQRASTPRIFRRPSIVIA
jgi:hypothetical protein